MCKLALKKITEEFGNGEFTISEHKDSFGSEETTCKFEEFVGKSQSIDLHTIVGIIYTCDVETNDDGEATEDNNMYSFDIYDRWCKLPRYVLERKGVMDFMERLGKLINVDYVFVYMPQ